MPSWIGGKNKMSWDQVRDLVKRGHEIANHTMHHKDLVGLSKTPDEMSREILDGYETIKRETGYEARVLCLPFNRHCAEVDAFATTNGFSLMLGRMPNTGEDFDGEKAAAFADKTVANGDWKYAMIHGITPGGGGWKAFNAEGQFEEVIKALVARKELWFPTWTEAMKVKSGK